MKTNKLPDGSTWNQFKLSNVTENQEVKVTFSPDTNADGIPDKYQTVVITAAADGAGTVDPLKNEITLGEDATFTVTPGEGMALYQVKSGDNVLYTNTSENPFTGTYVVSDVMEDTLLTFVFSADTDGDGIPDASETWYKVTMAGDDNVSVTSNGQPNEVNVKIGNSATVEFAPSAGYAVDTVTIDGESYINDGKTDAPNGIDWTSYTFDNVQDDHTITVTSAETTDDSGVADKYKLTVTPVIVGATGGQVTLSPQLVVYGHDVDISITPDEGMSVDTIETITDTYINDPDFGAAQVDGVGYETVQEAVDNVPTGSVVTLNEDITDTTTISGDKEITLDLAGHTINVANGRAIVADGATVNIGNAKEDSISTFALMNDLSAEDTAKEEGTVIASTIPVFAINGGDVTINGGYYESLTNMAVAAGGSGDDHGAGNVTINGGYFKGHESTLLAFKASTLTVNDGTFEALNNAVVAGNGSTGLGGTTINIHGGTFIGKQGTSGRIACGIYQPQTGVTTIDGGTWNIENGAGIVQRAGTVNISDSEWIMTGTSTGAVGDAQRQLGCYGVVMDTGAGYPNYADASIILSGVTMTSDAGIIDTTDKDGITGTVTINSGNYNHDVQPYVGESKVCVGVVAGGYSVTNGTAADADSMETLQAAVNNADVNRINITAPITLTQELQINRPITVIGSDNKIEISHQGKGITFLKDSVSTGISIESTADNTDWHSAYGIQFYTAQHRIDGFKSSGGNAAALVNSANVKMEGTIDVSGNTFGGIEVSKGSAQGLSAGMLDITDANIVNTSEEYAKPTIWIDGTTEDIGTVVGIGDMTMAIIAEQNQYYLDAAHAVESV